MATWFCSPTAPTWVAPEVSAEALQFHRSLPGYAPTPLLDLPDLATELGVGRVMVKDESSRLGLPAFKVLGASWACKQVLDRDAGAHLVTATDGNHGRAVARMAAHFEVGATVFVPHVMLSVTAERIASEGASVVRVEGDYDDAVRRAAAYAEDQPDRALVQDTAWEGYTQVPAWIIEGYQTLMREIDEQLEALGASVDLVAVPVGVGSLAEAVVRHYRRPVGPRPRVLSVEPDTAACVLESLSAGRRVTVATAATVMAGLNCGTVFELGLAGAALWLRRGCCNRRSRRRASRRRPGRARRLLRPLRRRDPRRGSHSSGRPRPTHRPGSGARRGRRPAQHRREQPMTRWS